MIGRKHTQEKEHARTGKKMVMYKPKTKVSEETNPVHTSDLAFQSLEL
jgi:hypothetical protein